MLYKEILLYRSAGTEALAHNISCMELSLLFKLAAYFSERFVYGMQKKKVGLTILLTQAPQLFSTGFNVGLSWCNRRWKKEHRTKKSHVHRHLFDPAH